LVTEIKLKYNKIKIFDEKLLLKLKLKCKLKKTNNNYKYE